jgi:hypothetical protein
MTNLLTKFLAQTKLQADQELIKRWEWDMRYHGDENIKQQVAHAKRTATALRNSCEKFKHLSPEQELAFKAAASGMRKLAEDLNRLGVWAKAYFVFCKKAREIQRANELELIASERWGDDVAALQLEADLVLELSSKDGRSAFAQWVHSSGLHTDVALENISACMNHIESGGSLRERMAQTVEANMKATDNKWYPFEGPRVICGWRIYESYLAYRKKLANNTKSFLRLIGQAT